MTVTPTWAGVVALAGLVIGSGGLISWLRFRSDDALTRAQTARTEAETESIITAAAEKALRLCSEALGKLEVQLGEAQREIVANAEELEEQRRRRQALQDELATEREITITLTRRIERMELNQSGRAV